MKRIVTAGEMREIDRITIEEKHIPGLVLMENAGLGVVRVVEEALQTIDGRRITILCGKGNNGGDGFVVARHLLNRGHDVSTGLVGDQSGVKGDALTNLRAAEGSGIEILTIESKRDLKRLGHGDLIVDALLGTGVSGRVTGFLGDVIEWINDAPAPVVSVDLPSGLHSDDGKVEGPCVRADFTATMAELKRGLVMPPGREQAGEITVVDIGSPEFVTQSVDVRTFLLEADDIVVRLPARPASAHKGVFGKVLIVAGSPGLTGAAALASMASLRVGCGLTILGTPRNLNPVLEEKLTEVMTRPLPESSRGTLSLEGEQEIRELISWADVLAIGPGLSTVPETSELIRKLVVESTIPTVIDADGLNAFEGHANLLDDARQNRILTPHYGELSRIIDVPIEKIQENPVEYARECAARFKSILVLKGAPTVIAVPGTGVFINSTGNSGMATAGSGDVLTGMVVGFLGQGISPADAAFCGVFLHGVAGDAAAELKGERTMVAGDLIECLDQAFRRIECR